MDDQDIFTQSFGLLGCHASQHKGLDTVVSWDLINMRRHALRAPAKSPVHQLVSSTQHQCEYVQQISFLHKRKKKKEKKGRHGPAPTFFVGNPCYLFAASLEEMYPPGI